MGFMKFVGLAFGAVLLLKAGSAVIGTGGSSYVDHAVTATQLSKLIGTNRSAVHSAVDAAIQKCVKQEIGGDVPQVFTFLFAEGLKFGLENKIDILKAGAVTPEQMMKDPKLAPKLMKLAAKYESELANLPADKLKNGMKAMELSRFAVANCAVADAGQQLQKQGLLPKSET
jgi:hypothetical protein